VIQVRNIEVRSFDLDHLDIFWEIDGTDEDLLRYQFFVLRSVDGAGGPFETIAGPFFNSYVLRDPEVHLLHKWRKYFYKIKVRDQDTGVEQEFGPQYLRAQPDRIALEIQRREQLLFREFAGRKALLFPRLTFGQHCRQCWDTGPRGNTIGRNKQQNCPTCFDTTYVGGFATPLLIYIQLDPAAESIQLSDASERAPVDTTARLSSFPPVKVKDMIVEAENRRWQVERVSSTRKLGAVVRQELALHMIPIGDIRYKVPIQESALASPSPEREFTRPMTSNYLMGPA